MSDDTIILICIGCYLFIAMLICSFLRVKYGDDIDNGIAMMFSICWGIRLAVLPFVALYLGLEKMWSIILKK